MAPRRCECNVRIPTSVQSTFRPGSARMRPGSIATYATLDTARDFSELDPSPTGHPICHAMRSGNRPKSMIHETSFN